MFEIIIRPAIIEDVEALSSMYCDMYDTLFSYGMPYRLNEETIENILMLQLKARTCGLFIAENQAGLVVGFVAVDVMRIDRKLTYDGNNIMGHIKDIYVNSTVRRTNVASKLLKTAENWAKDNGATIIECNVIVNNEPAQRFWNNQEYEVIGQIYCKKY